MNINLRPKKYSGQSRYGHYGSYATGFVKTPCLAIYNHWTGLVDWTGGLTLKILFLSFLMSLTSL